MNFQKWMNDERVMWGVFIAVIIPRLFGVGA